MMYYWVKFNQLLLWLLFRIYIIISSSKVYIKFGEVDDWYGHVVAANHQTYLDSFIIPAALPFKTVLKLTPIWFMGYRELFLNPLQRFVLRSWGTFPTKEVAGLNYGIPFSMETLAGNGCVTIFPEGRRVRTGEARAEAKPGVGVMAAEENVRLILAHITWSKGRGLPRATIAIDGPRQYQGATAQRILDDIYSLPLDRSALPEQKR